jgi:hypothetical protein
MEFIERAVAAAFDRSKGLLHLTVIKPGTSKNKRHYSSDLLKKSAPIFEGAKMFANHQTDDEARDRPEGSINNWVGCLQNVKAESDGTIKGTAVIIDPQFQTKLENLSKAGLLGTMGVSIRAIGETARRDGVDHVESLSSCRSVDFVTFAGAGGRADILESYEPLTEVDDSQKKQAERIQHYMSVKNCSLLEACIHSGMSNAEAVRYVEEHTRPEVIASLTELWKKQSPWLTESEARKLAETGREPECL